MSWSKYSLVFRLHSPLHVGLAKTGNLKQCRGHIPGRLLWAALTARLTRDLGHGAHARRYEEIGEKVRQNFRFRYLYPARLRPGVAGFSSPADLDEFAARWKENSKNFDYEFVGSYASAALDYTMRAAEPGALHETEHLLAHTRPHASMPSRPVFMVGDVYADDCVASDTDLANWQTAIRSLQLGAERKYGWGMVSLVAGLDSPETGIDEPVISFDRDAHLPAHAVASTQGLLGKVSDIRGEVEPMVGWEYNNDQPGKGKWRISGDPLICYVPGARVQKTMHLHIAPYGLLYSPVDDERRTGDDHGV